MTLLICRTCPRYDPRRSGHFSTALKRALDADPRNVPTLNVQCLGGCPGDGVIALDGPGKARLRFTHLTADDADAVLDAALAHHDSPTGHTDEWTIPAPIADRLSAITLKRNPAR